MTSFPATRKRQTLHSWKQISDYLHVAVRTTQRWRDESNLPVHYLGSGPKARVVAYTDELDLWIRDCRPPSPEEAAPAGMNRFRLLRWRAAAAMLVPLALIAAGVSLYRGLPLPRVPDRLAVEGSALAVYDRQGQLCWRRNLPNLDPNAYDPQSFLAINRLFTPNGPGSSVIADIDGDGNRELLFNYWPTQFYESPGKLICFEHNGKVRWEFRFGRERFFGDRQISDRYQGNLVRIVEARGKSWILSVSHHSSWFPGYAALLDPQTGIIYQEYWHPGWIISCNAYDLDGDGSQEILLAGANNPGPGLGHAGLAILKVAETRQPLAPDRVEPDVRAFSGGGEIAYVLFPRSDIQTAQGNIPMIDTLAIMDGRQIYVRVAGPENGDIAYHLDFALRVTDFRPGNSFAASHEEWRRKGVLDHRLTDEELAELGKAVVFNSTPDGNSPETHRLWKLP